MTPLFRWTRFDLRGLADRDRLLHACMAVRRLPGVAFVQLQPNGDQMVVTTAPDAALEFELAALSVLSVPDAATCPV